MRRFIAKGKIKEICSHIHIEDINFSLVGWQDRKVTPYTDIRICLCTYCIGRNIYKTNLGIRYFFYHVHYIRNKRFQPKNLGFEIFVPIYMMNGTYNLFHTNCFIQGLVLYK